MSILREQEIKNKVTVKGTLLEIDDEGLRVSDDKSGEIDTFTLDDFRMFIGKSFSLSISESVKREIENTSVEDDEDEE